MTLYNRALSLTEEYNIKSRRRNQRAMNRIKNIFQFRLFALKLWFRGDCSLLHVFYIMRPHWLRPKRYDVSLKLFGKPFIGDLGGIFLSMKEIVIENQDRTDLIQENDTVIDAGANMGLFSVFAAHEHPNATILAFEPTPETFGFLRENAKFYPNIKVFNFALGDKEEKSSLVIEGVSGANHIRNARPEEYGHEEGGIPIEIKTIDGLNTRVDFLKIDTEGYEANILNGAAETIKKYKPIIAMAHHHPEDETGLPELLNTIAPYDCELRHDCEEDFICKPVM